MDIYYISDVRYARDFNPTWNDTVVRFSHTPNFSMFVMEIDTENSTLREGSGLLSWPVHAFSVHQEAHHKIPNLPSQYQITTKAHAHHTIPTASMNPYTACHSADDDVPKLHQTEARFS